jgi:hypothetical protein
MNDMTTQKHQTEAKSTDHSPIFVTMALTDAEVIAAVSEFPVGPARNEFVSACVKVGVLALRAARGVVDGDTIRNEGNRLVDQLTERLTGYRTLLEENMSSTLTHYFDPKDGLFSTRIENLTKNDGELAGLMKNQVSDVQRQLNTTFEQFIGENSQFLELLSPTESNQMLKAMRGTVDEVMKASSNSILSQFSLDDPASALSRLVRDLTASHGNLTSALGERMGVMIGEFSLDKPDSALSRLVGRVEEAQKSITQEFSLDSADSALSRLKSEMNTQLKTLSDSQQSFQTEMVGLLSGIAAKKTAQAKSTTHGIVFEENVGQLLREIGSPSGDIIEDCGSTTGLIRASKVGDFVINLSPDSLAAGAKIVVEAKEAGGYTLASTLAEADEAKRNRGANISLFIHSAKTVPTEINESLSKFGNDIIVVWDSENETSNVVLRAGYLTAKALSIRASVKSSSEAASFEKIDKAIEVVRKQIEGFNEINTSGETITNGATKILNRARIMRTELEKQMEILAGEILLVKKD